MKHNLYKMFTKTLILLGVLSIQLIGTPTAIAAESSLITSVDELTDALMNSNDGDTILVGDITFKPMPMGMIVVPKNVTIKSGKQTNAVFTNATFALNGTTTDSSPLTVRFENVDFRGDQSGIPIDLNAPPTISSEMPGILKTMCAAIFKMNVNATYIGCSFEGYHYSYGGVFNAIYSSDDNKNALNLTLIDCSFRNNASKFGGSIYLSGYNHNVSLDARRCSFDANAAATGGAIWARESNIHLLDCSLIGNGYLNAEVNSPNGGALALYNCGVDLDGCLIAGNTSGGDGAGVFCEISPFKTLIMENCTVIGNTAAEDEGISVALAKTNFDTAAAAHIYFSSLFGKQNFAGNVELSGCLLVDKNISESEPNEENGYCLELIPESAQEKGLIPATPEHVSLPKDEYPIPKEVTDRIAGGKFADSLGKLQVGDNYEKEANIEIEDTPGHTEAVTLRYGDRIVLESPERKGYSFEGWEYPKGTPIESGKVFIGGELPEGKVTARWNFVLSENLYVIWVPILVIAAAGLLAFVLIRRKKKAVPDVVPAVENAAEEALTLPDDWIDRVCEKPEITGLISKREMEVLQKLLEGKSRKQIAEELFVTESTIKKHSASIYSKLDVHNRTELIYKLTKQ
ncbi:MAG: LuxR C-terminal-related transcriptional regulator [Clostridia bacterium]|nr:LuxR C-terminal-related transcriptional regulator [Clostridia bacterium]